ncbi:hypothetical protein [Marinomonas transparens]|uniref:Uncharacterized protein n=1 Tax=Marinomonas transparens TaxID=2795388 RepID=A0A934JU80_9GAMM|nr:hypothetical protein [Marinomonas transparens]MBJ7540063.1 hypothetical protein [Marinomonas transparens]
MRLRHRERHREVIKHEMYNLWRYKTNPRPELYASLILLGTYGFDFSFTSHKGVALVGYVMIMLSVIGLIVQKRGIKKLQKQGYALEWLNVVDQIVVFALIVLSYVLNDFEPKHTWSLLLVIVGYSYAGYKVSRNGRPYWRLYFFRSARSYFRELKTYAQLSK